MKKKIISTLTALGLFTSIGFADEALPCKPNQIYFGPELLEISVDTTINDVHVKGKKHFSGLRLGYEYFKPWTFYAGADLLSTISSHQFLAFEEDQPIYFSDQDAGFLNLDFRLGYTAAPKNLFFTPFLGVGLYGLGAPHYRGFHEGWVYLSTGLLSKFPINSVFSLGINLKCFKALYGNEQFQNRDKKTAVRSSPWGGEVGFPFIWNFNPRGTWTFDIEPYWTKLNFSEKQNVFGSKFLIGVHF